MKNVTPHRVRLSAVSHCAESISAQYHAAPSQEIEMSENPKLSNTAQSQTFRIYVMIFWKIQKYFKNPKMANTAPSPTLRSVILCQVRLCPVWCCNESDSAQYNTAGSQQLKFTADQKVSNTARSFGRNNFVFAGLSLPSIRILNLFLKICVLRNKAQHFLLTF